MSDETILLASHVTKRYGGQVALHDVTFRARRGAVNVLIGENGAGKSTLMRILSGVERADTGELRLKGEAIELKSPRDAARYGIAIVHQELSLLPNLDVTENIFAGRELVRAVGVIDRSREEARSAAALQQMRDPIAVGTGVAELPLGRRQVVELARTMAHGAEIVILDEPTSALSAAETETLFAVLAELKNAEVTVIYISHRLHELLHLGDWFTVLRGGVVVGEGARGEVDRAWIVERMSGRRENSEAWRGNVAEPQEMLSVHAVTGPGLGPVTCAVDKGEIVGIYGLLGSGRTELLETIAGARRFTGEVKVGGVRQRMDSVHAAMAAGVALVPEDRQRDGLVPDLSIRENVALAARGMMIAKREETARVKELCVALNLRTRDPELPVTTLSGGNAQKVLLARCLMLKPKVLLLDEPTRGVDVGAKAEIYAILRRLAEEGMAILFASSEIEETMLLAERVLVMRQGRVGAELRRDEMTDQALFEAASPRVAEVMP